MVIKLSLSKKILTDVVQHQNITKHIKCIIILNTKYCKTVHSIVQIIWPSVIRTFQIIRIIIFHTIVWVPHWLRYMDNSHILFNLHNIFVYFARFIRASLYVSVFTWRHVGHLYLGCRMHSSYSTEHIPVPSS